MKCPKCFNEIPDDSKTCPICSTIFASFFEEHKLTKKQIVFLFFHKYIFSILAITILLSLIIIKTTTENTKMKRITDVNNLVIDKTSKQYINDLYVSDERHYKYILNKKEQQLYDEIIEAIKQKKEIIEINPKDYNTTTSEFNIKVLKKIKETISMDHPELLNLGYIKTSENIDGLKIHIIYSLNEEATNNNINEIKNIIETIKEKTNNLSEYEKIKEIYKFIDEKTEQAETKEPTNYSAACIIEGHCNSEGYAKIAQILFQNTKINSILATGSLNSKYHEWNIVKIENKYYYYDQTENKLLFKNDKYELHNKKLMPKINGKKYISK